MPYIEPSALDMQKTLTPDTWKTIYAYLGQSDLGSIQSVAKSHYLLIKEFIEETVHLYNHLLLPQMMWINHHGRPLYIPVWQHQLCMEENSRRLISKPTPLYPYPIFRQILLHRMPDCLRVLGCSHHPLISSNKISSRGELKADRGQVLAASEKTLISGEIYRAQFNFIGKQYSGSLIGIARPLPGWDQDHFLLSTKPEIPFRFVLDGGHDASTYPQEWRSGASVNVALYQISDSFQQTHWYLGDQQKTQQRQVGFRSKLPSSISLELDLSNQCNRKLNIINIGGSKTMLIDGLKGDYVWVAILCNKGINGSNATTKLQMKEIKTSRG